MHSRKMFTAAVLAATAAVGAGGATSATAAAGADTSAIQVVGAGQVVDTGHGVDIQLNRADRCVGVPGDRACKSVVDGNQPPAAGHQSASRPGATPPARCTPRCTPATGGRHG